MFEERYKALSSAEKNYLLHMLMSYCSILLL